jgi:nicotinamide mononucleotide transporter
MDSLELFGFVTGVIGVWLATKENPWNWPIGIINVSLYAIVFYQSKLYGDMALQLFYIVMGFYGWYLWLKGNGEIKLQIANCEWRSARYLILTSVLGFFAVAFFLKRTDSNVPYLDGLTTVLSIAATWMMAKKYIEHWLVWIFVDLVYVGLYVYKLLYLTAVLYFIFTILAVYGYSEWKKTMKLQTV